MSSDTEKLQLIESGCNFLFNPYLSSHSQYMKLYSSFPTIATINKPESVLSSMTKLLIDTRNQSNITDSILAINSEDLDIGTKLNNYKDLLSHMPFSFRHNNLQTKILLELFHLEEQKKLITKPEFKKYYK